VFKANGEMFLKIMERRRVKLDGLFNLEGLVSLLRRTILFFGLFDSARKLWHK
jgi:hypothetical protein